MHTYLAPPGVKAAEEADAFDRYAAAVQEVTAPDE